MKKFLPKAAIVFFIFISGLGMNTGNNNPSVLKKGNIEYEAGTVIVKFKKQIKETGNRTVSLPQELQNEIIKLNVIHEKKVFSLKGRFINNSLNNIVEIKYSSGDDPIKVAAKLKSNNEVEWTEPRYVYKTTFTPNDPGIANQWYLAQIKAYEGWDISKGDSSIIIGIVDSGVQWDHPDLVNNIWQNLGEDANHNGHTIEWTGSSWIFDPGDLNGIDDDGNGKIDDLVGWDFAGADGNSPDNNPTEDSPVHGTFVAGLAGATTNNNIGIASVGFNSSILAVKTAPAYSTSILYPYEGIVYAAQMGSKVINCSFSGSGYSILGQEAVDFATARGALVVAAAGNDNVNSPQYPSAYKNVLSVASTGRQDTKSDFSNYGPTIDVAAPGEDMYSTWDGSTYMAGGRGTSHSSPLTAGLAALVWAKFPGYTPLQVGEQIRVNTDNIYAKNVKYQDNLGSGRINVYKTLTNTKSISVRATDVKFFDDPPGGNGNGIFEAGETGTVSIKFMNYLNPTSNLSVSLESKTSYATVTNGTFNAGAVATLDSFDNYSAKFSFVIASVIPSNVDLLFKLNFSDGTYSDFQLIRTIGNPSYANQTGNDITVTITSKGTIAFNDFPSNLEGDGFHYKNGPNLLFEGALMTAISPTIVSDAARGIGAGQDDDFKTLQPFKLEVPGAVADQEGSSIFNDDYSTTKMGLTIKQHSYTFSDVKDTNFIIMRYDLTNTSDSTLNNLFAGIYFDWDMVYGSGENDYTAYDYQGNLGYVYHDGGNPDTWIGTALISSDNYGFYAIDNWNNDGGINLNNGFLPADKYKALSSGIGKDHAGFADISQVISGGPYSLKPNKTITVAFAIAGGNNIDDLRSAIANAREKYKSIPTGINELYNKSLLYSFSLSQNYPNPFNPVTVIKYEVPAANNGKAANVNLKVFDVLGKEIASLVNEEKSAGIYKVMFNGNSLPSGVYFYRLKIGNNSDVKKMVLLR